MLSLTHETKPWSRDDAALQGGHRHHHRAFMHKEETAINRRGPNLFYTRELH